MLATELPVGLSLPQPFRDPRVVLPGILAIQGPAYHEGSNAISTFCRSFEAKDAIRGFPLIVIVDDSEFTARSEQTFSGLLSLAPIRPSTSKESGLSLTRNTGPCGAQWSSTLGSSPITPPPLIDDAQIERKVDLLAAPGGPLHGVY